MEPASAALECDPTELDDLHLLDLVTEGCPAPSCPGLPQSGRSTQELIEVLGLEPATARRLAAALELGRRALLHGPRGEPCFGTGEQVFQFLAPRLCGERVECFHVLYLNAKGGLISERRVSQGTLTTSLVHPREVYAPALVHRCAALVVAHNHPSGDPQPSTQDRATTRRLVRAGRLLGVDLLDHVILGHGSYFSFQEEGLLGIS